MKRKKKRNEKRVKRNKKTVAWRLVGRGLVWREDVQVGVGMGLAHPGPVMNACALGWRIRPRQKGGCRGAGRPPAN